MKIELKRRWLEEFSFRKEFITRCSWSFTQDTQMARTKQTAPRMTEFRKEKETARMSTSGTKRELHGEPEPPKKKPRTRDTADGERETGAAEEGHKWFDANHDEPEAELTGDETGEETGDEDDPEAMLANTRRERSVDIDVCTEELLQMFEQQRRLFQKMKNYVKRINENRDAIKAANRRAGRSLYGDAY